MGKKKKKKYDRIKALKRQSRAEQQPHGKGGTHCDKKDRRVHKMSTQDYLDEVEDEENSEIEGEENGDC